MKRIYITLFALTFSVALFAQNNDEPTLAKMAAKTDTTEKNGNTPEPELKKAEQNSTVPNKNEQSSTSEEPKLAPAAKNPQ